LAANVRGGMAGREGANCSMRDPFTVLGVAEDAGDAEIRRRYLALVREFPPDRDPDRFRDYRAAYDALSDERKRLETKLLHTNEAALSRLTAAALQTASPGSERATKQTVAALLSEGIMRTLAD
jgi:DnaJ-class molecular chaperone